MEDNNVRIVIQINLSASLSPKDHLTISKILFANDVNKSPTIQTLIHKLCVKTRVKTTFNDEDDQDEILTYWKYNSNLATLPRFESELLNLYHEKIDREFKLLDRNKSFRLIGTNTVRQLSLPELMFLRKQILDYIDRKKQLGEVELL